MELVAEVILLGRKDRSWEDEYPRDDQFFRRRKWSRKYSSLRNDFPCWCLRETL